MRVLRVEGLPEAPLDAAADFLSRVVPSLPGDDDLILAFPPADHSHRGWRLAAVQELARVAAPRRVNAVAAQSEAGLAAARALLDPGQGITGQYLVLDEATMLSDPP